MVVCIVPGCTNRNISWVAPVPVDGQLRDCWREAIFGGTGQMLSVLEGGHVCQVHFLPGQQPEYGEMYREPALFFVENSWRKVACCQLCLQYHPVERMFNRKGYLGGSLTLQSVAFKYFRVRQFTPINSGEQESFFCANCVVLIDITDRFGDSIVEKGRAYERMLRKVAKTMVAFERVGRGDGSGEEDEGEGFVKKEGLKEPKILNAGFCQAKSSDCTMEENELETIELDDEDEVQIKKEPDLEEPSVEIKQEINESDSEAALLQIKQEVPDEDLSIFPVNVKEEIPEEQTPPAKRQRIEHKFECLICKEIFKYEFTLKNHLKKVHKDFPEDKCILCWKTIFPRGCLSKCGTCTDLLLEAINTKRKFANLKILNKQLGEASSEHYCVPCNMSFQTKPSLVHHRKQLSCKQSKSVCSQCNENFLLEESLVAHMEVAHVPPVQIQCCKFCGEIFHPNLFKLHRMLICGKNLPEPDEIHLKRCVVLFYRQKLQATKAHSLLRSMFGETIRITLDVINSLYSQFEQDNYTIGDPVQTSIKHLIDENSTINPEELSKQVGIDLDTVQLQVNILGLMQKYGRWVPQNLPPSLKKNRFNFCRALLARFKDNTNLNNMILCSERWVYYGNPPNQDTKEPTIFTKALLCIWWDQRGLIFHELVTPDQAACKERYHAQFSRFTKTMTQKRPAIKHQMIFQYGINDPVARQELKGILSGIGWEMLRHPAHSPDIDPTDYHLFQAMRYGFEELYFANPGQVYEWVAETFRQKPQVFFIQGIRMLLKRWEKVVENKGDFCGQ